MKKIISILTPPKNWQTPVVIALGIFFGLGFYVLNISNAVSYLSDKPETCINCHVMIPQYAAWNHSSHRRVATCNDCHVPHDNVFHKYLFKAQDGLRHATFFTLRLEPQVIQIKEAGKKAVQENCIRCHEFLNHNVNTHDVTGDNYKEGKGKLCWSCHLETPHGRVNSLSATPYAKKSVNEYPIPEWMKKEMK